jgi:hypothetical protein
MDSYQDLLQNGNCLFVLVVFDEYTRDTSLQFERVFMRLIVYLQEKLKFGK